MAERFVDDTPDERASSVSVIAAHRVALERRLEVDRHERRRREFERRKRRVRIRRHRLIALGVVGLGGLVAWMAVGATTGQAAAAHRAARGQFHPAARSVSIVPGHVSGLTWPTVGEGAIAVLGAGLMARSPAERVVPIASLTKMMTAYVVLRDHPLALGAEGPNFVMTSADVAAWVQASQSGDSNIPVQAGEVLTEHQLLEALLIPSADNIASFLATWDAGSIARFVAKMNRTARSLGLSATTYADASGVNPKSRSTAADQARLAALLMGNPVVRSIVSKPQLAFPVAGTIWNYNPALGVDGIIGVKSGFTSEAEGCLATAAFRSVGGKSVLVISVSLGQPGGLGEAAQSDENLLSEASSQLVEYRPVAANAPLGSVTVRGTPAHGISLVGAAPLLVAWPGLRITEHVVLSSAAVASSRPRQQASVGNVEWSTPSGVLGSAPVRLTAAASSS